jgi:hypothetical protein
LSRAYRTACSFLTEDAFIRRLVFDDYFHFGEKSGNKTMYKALTLIILVAVGTACASRSYNTHPKQFQRLSSSVNDPKVDIDLCPSCINEAVELINVVLNLVLDEGIEKTCNGLCSAVANKTGSKALGDLCDVACLGLGIDEFIKVIVKADIDPIYYCQLVDMCPSKKHS